MPPNSRSASSKRRLAALPSARCKPMHSASSKPIRVRARLFKSIKPWRCLLRSAIQPSRPAPTLLALEWFVPDVECQEDYDCAEGLRCLGNQCIADSPSCSSDREVIECPPGQVCVNGLCEDPNENHCQDSSDCPDEHNCINTGAALSVTVSAASMTTARCIGLATSTEVSVRAYRRACAEMIAHVSCTA